jgi:uncharacterized protein with PQ loop repeat
MKLILSDVLGYIGAFFLIMRLTPIIYDQLNKPSKINLYFLGMEFIACVFLGSSAILIRSTPFIIANILSFINLMIIVSVQIRIRCFKSISHNENEQDELEKQSSEISDEIEKQSSEIPDVRIIPIMETQFCF